VSTTPSPRPFAYADNRLTCSGADLAELADTYGTPLYVYSADAIRERVDLLRGQS
jgi:diaminopimelate decarboxylase